MIIDTDDYRFIIDDSQGFRLVFTTTATLQLTGEKTPLWWCEFPDDDCRDAMCAWVGARQALWPEWGLLAEEQGGDALDRHIVALSKAEPLEVPQGVMLSNGDDPRELDLAVMFSDLRSRRVRRHRFRSAAARRRFLDWFYADGHHECAWSIVLVGLLQGSQRLGEVLDMLARPTRRAT